MRQPIAGRAWNRLTHFASGAYLARDGALAAFERQFKKDSLGHRVHTWIAMLTLAAICSRTAVAEFAIIPLAAYSLIRALNIWRCWIYAALSPVGLLMLALGAWAWLSLLWTPDLTQGLDEAYNTRWVLLPGMLWPVLDQRRKLILAIVCGMLLANLSQVWHAIGVRFDIDFMRFPRMPDRNSGWWQPVVGGCMLTAALGLHLPAAIMGVGRTRLLGAAGSLITLLAILATGTRGAMLASIGLIAIVCAVAFVRMARTGGLKRRGVLISVVIGAIAIIGAGAVMGPWGGGLARRFDAARADLDRAIEHKDFNTDTGARLLMAWKGIEATREHPLIGVGTGGYKHWCFEDLRRQGIDPAQRSIHAHAHNAYIHIASSFGLPALLVALAALAAAIVGGLSRGVRGGESGERRGGERDLESGRESGEDAPPRWLNLGTYDAGPAFAIMGLMLVAMFDPIITNMQTCALLCALMGLCVMPRVDKRENVSIAAPEGART